ncbi:type I restriction enzyme specificity HsdS domain protein [Mycoplasma haemocanis str. Illinois]|uniref:Type I restriction enzyme specificity HsdS domain protein n=1 Tax=Mycoplasma haemocanis (strain Illinois) TaxID=1111676 RepID=I6RHQ7_MYCHN|nr:type I restriction enzyme specificity HsdS domain protein [Mycoplasma haemocanis str. Illinois]
MVSFKSFLSEDKNVEYLELRKVCEIRAGICFNPSLYRDSGFPVITVRNVQDGQIITDNYR